MANASGFPLIVNASGFPPMANNTEFPLTNATKAPAVGNNNIHRVIIVSLLSFVIIAGLVGNSLIIATICGRRSMRTPCNFFIMNIAIADLIVAIALTPLRMAELYKGWPLGEFLCQFFGPLQDAIVCVSVVSHTVIALERYRGIITPFKPKLSMRKAKIVIAVIYCACYVSVGVPLAIVLNQVEEKGLKYCLAVKWPSITHRRVFEVYLVVIYMCLPLVLQTGLYVKIMATIKREDASAQLTRSGTVEQRRNQIRKKARLVKMLIVLLTVFQVCFIPRLIYMIVSEFTTKSFKEENRQIFSIASITTITLYYIKHVLNPFILFAMSTEFRKNGIICRKICYNKLDVVSSIVRYVSRKSNAEEKELRTLTDTSLKSQRDNEAIL